MAPVFFAGFRRKIELSDLRDTKRVADAFGSETPVALGFKCI